MFDKNNRHHRKLLITYSWYLLGYECCFILISHILFQEVPQNPYLELWLNRELTCLNNQIIDDDKPLHKYSDVK